MRAADVLSRGARPRAARGAGLVEVLVALVVLSVGMLGVAAMIVQALRSSRSALIRTQAVNLVSDMADRIRANAGAGAAYALASYAGSPQMRNCVPTHVAGSGANCTVEQLAEDDLARWQAAVREALPGDGDYPRADVEHLRAPGQPDRYRIRVTWREPSEPEDLSYQAEIELLPRT